MDFLPQIAWDGEEGFYSTSNARQFSYEAFPSNSQVCLKLKLHNGFHPSFIILGYDSNFGSSRFFAGRNGGSMGDEGLDDYASISQLNDLLFPSDSLSTLADYRPYSSLQAKSQKSDTLGEVCVTIVYIFSFGLSFSYSKFGDAVSFIYLARFFYSSSYPIFAFNPFSISNPQSGLQIVFFLIISSFTIYPVI